MSQPSNTSQPEKLEAPEFACSPVRHAINFMQKEIAELDEQGDIPAELSTDIYSVPNEVSRLCGKLCTAGCARDLYFKAEESGIHLPPSDDRDRLFSIVSDTLALEFVANAIDPDMDEAVTIELPPATGEELKEIVTRRLNLFQDTELLKQFVDIHNSKKPQDLITVEEMGTKFKNAITPVKDDETWDKLAEFCKGNVRLALQLMSYFQVVFPVFRSSDPADIELANDIASTQTFRDEGYRKDNKGFRPNNPYEISSIDIIKIANMIDKDGWLYLPTDNGLHTMVFVTENPEEYVAWQIDANGAIDLIEGNPNVLPSDVTLKAVEAKSHEA